jgi:hypothetical protein
VVAPELAQRGDKVVFDNFSACFINMCWRGRPAIRANQRLLAGIPNGFGATSGAVKFLESGCGWH